MDREELRRVLEGLLFASDSPLTLSQFVETVGAEPQEISEALGELGRHYDEGRHGVALTEMAGGWLVTTREEHAEWIRKMLRGKRKARLSRAALETLAIVAYKQPVTRPEIESLRGVDSGSALATLLERDLITIRGRADVVGRPLLYATTAEFLSYFGLRDLAEMPKPEELQALIQAREGESEEESEGIAVPVIAGPAEPGDEGHDPGAGAETGATPEADAPDDESGR